MIERISIIGPRTPADEKLQKYITHKIGHLDHYLPRAGRASIHAEVRLDDGKSHKHEAHRNHATCDVTLHLPHEVIHMAETTLNLYAAVDIVEAKLKQRILKYKQLHMSNGLRRRLYNRLLRRAPAEL